MFVFHFLSPFLFTHLTHTIDIIAARNGNLGVGELFAAAGQLLIGQQDPLELHLVIIGIADKAGVHREIILLFGRAHDLGAASLDHLIMGIHIRLIMAIQRDAHAHRAGRDRATVGILAETQIAITGIKDVALIAGILHLYQLQAHHFLIKL